MPTTTTQPAGQLCQVATEATRILATSHHRPLARVRCEHADGVLKLHGHVKTFYMKQLAQALVQRLAGVRYVENCIEVGTV